MVLAVDVHYPPEAAVVAGVLFESFSDAAPKAELVLRLPQAAPYEPGSFYRRELPCILALLERLKAVPRLIVVDGYVRLGANGRPGLGLQLWTALAEKVPVIGVAKTLYAGTPEEYAVFRGRASRPLYVTSEGIRAEEAKALIRSMHGEHRIPTLLKRVDRLCRGEVV